MNTRLQAAVALALIGLSTVAVTHQAQACGLNLVKTANGHWTIAPPAKMSASAARKMFVAAGAPRGARAIPNPLQFLEPIAGLYEVMLTSDGNDGPNGLPPGVPVDHSYVQWHADGNEIMNSGRPAGDGNFCMGTWTQTGVRTYTLNHFMLSWAQYASDAPDPNLPPASPPPGALYVNNQFIGPASLQETITLAKDGQSYTGTFVLTQYDTSYDIITPGGVPITGTVTGTRKTVTSPVTY